jgi:hypothetical protein
MCIIRARIYVSAEKKEVAARRWVQKQTEPAPQVPARL